MLFLDYEKVNKKVQKKRKIKIIYKILKRKKRSFDFTKSSHIISIIKKRIEHSKRHFTPRHCFLLLVDNVVKRSFILKFVILVAIFVFL